MIGACLVYSLLSLVAYWPIVPGQGGRIPTCACGDPALQTWFLGWIPYALLHGHNPLFSAWTNYPFGVNLAQNTEMPLLGLLMTPLTLLVSPIASYNFLLWLAFPASAGSMFFVIKRWTGSTVAAFTGGLLYGFSAYTVGQGVGHVMLSFVPLPPLFIYQVYKLVIRQEGNPYHEGFLLGLIAVAQFFIEPEIVATLAIVAALGIFLLIASNWGSVTPTVVAYFLKGLAPCVGLLFIFGAYPLWFAEFGPRHFTGPVRPVNNVFHSDVLGPVIPTLSQHFAPGAVHGIGGKLGNVENGSYLGAPLLVLTALLGWRSRKNRWVPFAAALAALSYVLSLGSRLQVWAHQTSTPLPFALVDRLPLLNNVVPSRFSLFQAMFISILVALGISELLSSRRDPPASRRQDLWRRNAAHSAIVGLGFLSILTLLPRWPYSSVPSSVPAIFRSPELEKIPANSVVLTYPFPYYPYNQAMTWQAVARMRFKEVGTYALVPTSTGTATPLPAVLSPPDVQTFLINQEDGQPSRAPQLSAELVRNFRHYLTNYDIEAVIDDPSGSYPGSYPYGVVNATRLFTLAMGPPEEVDGAAVWFDVPGLLTGFGQ